MLSTITLAASLLLLLIAGIAAWALCLRWGLWWAGAPPVTMRRVVAASVLVYFVQLPVESLFALLPVSSPIPSLIIGAAGFVASVLIAISLIARVFGLSLLRSLQAWLPTLVATSVMLLGASFVFRPFLFA